MTRLSAFCERVTSAVLESWERSKDRRSMTRNERIDAARAILEREVRAFSFEVAYFIRDSGVAYGPPPTTDRVSAWLDSPAEGTK